MRRAGRRRIERAMRRECILEVGNLHFGENLVSLPVIILFGEMLDVMQYFFIFIRIWIRNRAHD